LFGGLVADHFGYRQAFIAFGVLCLLSLIIIHFAVTERFVPAPRTEKKPILQEIRGIIAVPGLGIILIVQFLIQFSIMNIAPVLPLYVQTLAPDLVYIASTCGAIIAISGLTSALASAGMGHLSKLFDHRRILLVSAACSAVFFAAQAASTSVLILGIMRGVSGFFLGAMLPTINAVIFLLIPPAKRGVAYGVTTGAMQMGNVLGPLTGGTVALYLGIPAVFWVTAGLFAAVAIWVLLYVRNPEPQPRLS